MATWQDSKHKPYTNRRTSHPGHIGVLCFTCYCDTHNCRYCRNYNILFPNIPNKTHQNDVCKMNFVNLKCNGNAKGKKAINQMCLICSMYILSILYVYICIYISMYTVYSICIYVCIYVYMYI